MQKYVLALDQGTTSSRAILFDHTGNIKSIAQREFTQHFPQPGWVEHDALEIWQTQLAVARQSLESAAAAPSEVAAIGITNQRETTVVWERDTGRPIANAIVWQDRRTAGFCESLKQQGLAATFQQKTGLVIDAYFSATKVRWLLDNVPEARAKAAAGKLAFGTIDSWLIWQLTNGQRHATDITNASRTMMFNINECTWDEEILAIMDIPRDMLPEVVPSSGVCAQSDAGLLGESLPIAGIAGDQQAALFGQMCTQPGMLKNTYGTGCFMVLNTGDRPVASQNNLLTTIAWQFGGKVTYALEGSIFIAGAVVQWLRDGLGIIKSSGDVESLARSVEDNGGIYLVPAFAGLGAPHWDQFARGAIVGLTRGTSAGHFARAALESIAFQTLDVLQAMKEDAHMPVSELRVDGGATANNTLMQFQSDVIGAPVVRPIVAETTALGAAYFAGLAAGFWQGLDELQAQWQEDKRFGPTMPQEKVQYLTSGWRRAVERAKAWEREDAFVN